MKKREFKSLKRKSGIRKPNKLIIIASEGKYPEENYFNCLKEKYLTIYIHFIDKINNRSAPKHLIKLLDKFKKEYNCRNNMDEFWLLCDRDQWTKSNISSISKECKQKKYNLAVSNPCFEVWILLHIKDITEYSEEKKKLIEENKKINSKNYIETELSNLLKGYNKKKFKCNKIIDKIEKAILNAKKIDTESYSWPNEIGTHVYKLVKNIINI